MRKGIGRGLLGGISVAAVSIAVVAPGASASSTVEYDRAGQSTTPPSVDNVTEPPVQERPNQNQNTRHNHGGGLGAPSSGTSGRGGGGGGSLGGVPWKL